MAYEPQSVSHGLGLQINTEMDWVLAKWITLFLRNEFINFFIVIVMIATTILN